MEAAEVVEKKAPPKRPSVWRSVVMFLSIVGPGVITGNLDNDAAGIGTYSQAGAQFGYEFLWVLIPVTVALVVVQEICVRLGVVTGKGLGDLIRERFGVRVTIVVILGLLVTNVLTTVAEFAGVAASADIFHPDARYFAVPAAAIFVALLVLRLNYKIVEKIFLWACVVYATYVVSGLLARPDWHAVAFNTFVPHITWSTAWLVMFLSVVGTTITPWMQFYIQSSVVEKGIKIKELRYSQIDVVSGCLVTDVISYFIIVACGATLYYHGMTNIATADQAARALGPLAGQYAEVLFAVGLLNASLFAASVLPLSTAYTVCEALGFESGVGKNLRDAPFFYSLYIAIIAVGAAAVLVLRVPLFAILVWSQAVAGMLLPFIVIAMQVLVNDKQLMGKYVNGPAFNVVAWLTIGAVLLATLALFGLSLTGATQ